MEEIYLPAPLPHQIKVLSLPSSISKFRNSFYRHAAGPAFTDVNPKPGKRGGWGLTNWYEQTRTVLLKKWGRTGRICKAGFSALLAKKTREYNRPDHG